MENKAHILNKESFLKKYKLQDLYREELIEWCLQMPAQLWDECAKAYDEDTYADWEKRNKALQVGVDGDGKASKLPEDAKAIAGNKILRRKGDQV